MLLYRPGEACGLLESIFQPIVQVCDSFRLVVAFGSREYRCSNKISTLNTKTFSVPCIDFDESADCATMKGNGQCEIEGKEGDIARFRCFKTCTGC